MKKLFIAIIILVIAIGGGAFYGGLRYGLDKNSAAQPQASNLPNFRDMTDEQRQQMSERFGANLGAGLRGINGDRRAGNFISGEVIAKEEQSITVKLPDGGSKIIFFSETTQISKSVIGSSDDLKQGEAVIVTGDANTDGSLTAKTIQIRENLER